MIGSLSMSLSSLCVVTNALRLRFFKTKFAFSNVSKSVNDEGINLSLTVENIGDYDGAEVLQVYLSGRNCDVVMLAFGSLLCEVFRK